MQCKARLRQAVLTDRHGDRRCMQSEKSTLSPKDRRRQTIKRRMQAVGLCIQSEIPCIQSERGGRRKAFLQTQGSGCMSAGRKKGVAVPGMPVICVRAAL